ncbi:MAG: DUF3099 domain-containing protein [Actinomycetales bacterium]|nr:DUF3099 domain-containing protein [Actinomycetales bacterium]
MSRASNQESAQTVTTVPVSAAEDRAFRQRAYLISMSLRVICFLAAVLLPAPMPVRIVLISGAIFLPYFAVVVANAARRRTSEHPQSVGSHRGDRAELT